MDVLFNIKEAASKLKVSPLTLRGWIYKGRLTPVKLGRRVLLTERELERFIEEGKRQGKKLTLVPIHDATGIYSETLCCLCWQCLRSQGLWR